MRLIDVLRQKGLIVSLSQSKRLTTMGAIKINGQIVIDIHSDLEIKSGDVLEVGRTKIQID